MVRKCSFYDLYDLEEDAGLAPDIAATFVSVVCAGAIDGMLVWTEKPSEKRCKAFGNLQLGSFFCGRKHKFGFNLQAVCDSENHFLEFWITHPALASDFITFMLSDFNKKRQTPGFLASGLVLFGDTAYVSNATMATPYKRVKEGVKDDYNYFHSQLRIRIEMTFGMLAHRWGILRRPMSTKMSMNRQTAIVGTCIRLHNFCLETLPQGSGAEIETDDAEDVDDVETNILPLAPRYEVHVQRAGGLLYGAHGHPDSLLDGGHYFDDVTDVDLLRCTQDHHRRRLRLLAEEGGKHRPCC